MFFLNFAFGTASNSSAQNFLSNPAATVTPTPVDDSVEITLDSDTVCNKLPPGQRPPEGQECSGDMKVEVAVSGSNNSQSDYRYFVSGGNVIGKGAKVTWDLTGAQPGTYEIKVEVRDKRGSLKQSAKKVVTAISEPACGLCVCPSLSVKANESQTKPGEEITFTANVEGGFGETVTYKWTISEGEIVEGQGTPVIKVATNRQMTGKTVKAEVEIGGICEQCIQTTESASVSIIAAETDKK